VDKQEYKILSEEIMTLVANEQFPEAAEIADRIDWRKVRSYSMLQKISDLYQLNRRYDDALEIMLLAYDRNPKSKNSVYSLCELYLEMNDLVNALQFLAIFKKLSPNDSGIYILQYKVLEQENASLEDKIELLEEFSRKDYREEWAYQLAYLYHRIGLATKCVEACNDLITWFGDGPFVIKAMELKMLHCRLTPEQQKVYDARNEIADQIEAYESDEYTSEKPEPGVMPEIGEEDFHVKTIDMSKFNTINLQKALAESMRELMGEEENSDEQNSRITNKLVEPLMDDGDYNNDYESEELAEEEMISDEEILALEEDMPEEELVYEDEAEYVEESSYKEETEYVEEPSYEEAAEYAEEPSYEEGTEHVQESQEEENQDKEVFFEDKTGDIILDRVPIGANPDLSFLGNIPITPIPNPIPNPVPTPVPSPVPTKEVSEVQTQSSGFDDVLSLGQDGQISLVVPTDNIIEKQITGQMNLEEVLQEWENIRNNKEKQQQEEARKSIMEKTGRIFADYSKKNRNGLLEQLEKEQRIFSEKYKMDDIEFRKVEDILDENASGPKGPTIWDEVDAAIKADSTEVGEDLAAAAEIGADLAAVGVGEDLAAKEMAIAATAAAGGLALDAVDGVISAMSGSVDAVDGPTDEEDINAEGTEFEGEETYAEGTEFEDDETYAEGTEFEGEETYAEGTEFEDEETYAEGEEYEDSTLNTAQIDSIGDALEAVADKVGVEVIQESVEVDQAPDDEDREFSNDEQQLFSDFLYSKKMRRQILEAIDQISMASYVDNVIITGESANGVIDLAKVIVKEIQMIDGNFIASKVAKISGSKMNRKDITAMFSQLTNGALIVEKASDMTKDTMENITRVLENFQDGMIIILTDTKKGMEKLISEYELLTGYFNARIDILPMSDNALVEYAKKYAYSKEYKIDEERAVLALHQRINELQIGEHNVSTREIEEIVDAAIAHANKPKISAFIDILVAKRYDYEDMIILKEKDFYR